VDSYSFLVPQNFTLNLETGVPDAKLNLF